MVNINEIEKLVIDQFPYAIPYPNQIDTIVKIVDEFVNKEKIHVVLDAPTGSGKSVIAYTVVKVLNKLRVIWRTTIITTTKALQAQYSIEFPEIYPLKSKTNYECPKGKGFYMSPECLNHCKAGKCDPKRFCPYVTTRNHWCDEAKIRNTNTAFMLEACGSLVKTPERFSDFMVIDEAHRLEELILDHAKCEFSTWALHELTYVNVMIPVYESHKLIIRLLNHCGTIASTQEDSMIEVDEEIKGLSNDLSSELTSLKDKVQGYIDKLDTCDQDEAETAGYLFQLIESLNNMENNASMLGSVELGTRLHVSTGEGYLELKILDAKVMSQYSLFSKAKRYLHMSGTICGYEYHLRKLGIDPSISSYIEVPNHIPIKNRQIQALGNFRIRGNSYDENWKSIEFCDKLLDYYWDKHGFIFLPSYEMCGTYLTNTRHKDRLVLPESMEDARTLMRMPDNKVLVSPALVEGIDLKDDMCRFAIIPRIPYLYLGDPIIRLKNKTEPDFYFRTTILRLVQILGRGIRTTEDWCHLYVFDSSLKILVDKNREFFPKWFLDAIVWRF